MPPAARCRRRPLGFTLIELSVVAATVTAVPAGAYLRAQQKADETVCQNNLRNIGQAVQMAMMEDEVLPKAAFYPADPLNGADSIRKVLQGQGDMSRVMVCPALPEALQKKGLTFVYNDALGGQRPPEGADRKWLMTEITCVSSRSPLPHPSGFGFLFADAHAGAGKDLPASIVNARAEMEAQQQAPAKPAPVPAPPPKK